MYHLCKIDSQMSPQSRPGRKVTGYLPTLDGWRTIAIAMVVLSHDRIHKVGAVSTQWFQQNGGRGVEVFFALSGLLICSRLLQEEKLRGHVDLRGFYIRRICRIQPAALLYLAVIGILMLAHVLDREPSEMLCSVLLIRNIFPLHPPPGQWYTGHFWSLSVEEHFYLLLPGFLVLVRAHRVRYLTAAVIVLEIWRALVYHLSVLQFGYIFAFRTDIAINIILVGALTAILLEHHSVKAFLFDFAQPWVAFSLLALCVLGLKLLPFPMLFNPVVICTYSLLIISTMLHPCTLIGRFLELRIFRFLGKISYSLYLWQMLFFTYHQPVPPPHSAILRLIQGTPLRYVALFTVSVLSYYFIEKPMMRLGHRLARPATEGRGDLDDPAQNQQQIRAIEA